MLNFGAARAVDFLPDDDARAWLAEGLRDLAARLGEHASTPRVLADVDRPEDLDGLFEMMCGVQAEVGQEDVEFMLLEMPADKPEIPKGFVPLGNPEGQLMHTFARESEFLTIVVPAIFRVPELLFGSVARELGRIGVHRVGGHMVDPEDFEGDAELAAIALGMGVWVANGAYIFDNACCGGGCGIDLTSIRAGLSLPEACFAAALDGHRKGLSRRAIGKHLEPTQRAAFKRSWGWVDKQPELAALTSASASALGEG
jgi:hypothetical protein